MTEWRTEITLYADDKLYARMALGDADLNVLLSGLPRFAQDFVRKTVAQVLTTMRVEVPE